MKNYNKISKCLGIIALTFVMIPIISSKVQAACSNALGNSSQYNLIVLNDLNQTGSDTEGRIAVGGNANLKDYNVGFQLSGNSDVLVVGNNLNFENGKVENGNALFGGTSSILNVDIPNGSFQNSSTTDFNAIKADLYSKSSYFASILENGTVSFDSMSSHLNLTGNDSNLNVFKVNATDLSNATELNINAPVSSTILVNVMGSPAIAANMGININGIPSSNILFNFYQAANLTLFGIGFEGSILAPYADTNFNSGAINGNLVVKSLSGNGQVNMKLFTGCVNGGSIGGETTVTPTLTPTPVQTTDAPVVTTTVVVSSTPSGNVLGANTSDPSDPGSVKGAGTVLANTGVELYSSIALGLIIIVGLILTTATKRNYKLLIKK